jgi:hypothetical protein
MPMPSFHTTAWRQRPSSTFAFRAHRRRVLPSANDQNLSPSSDPKPNITRMNRLFERKFQKAPDLKDPKGQEICAEKHDQH